jgi:alpha-ribazole phosphatase/probable phosphoglycerate mutase
MSTRIFLIRHGETLWNLEKRCQGFTDIPLSETGEKQAELLSRALSRETLAAVYASDLIRARRTAEIIARPHGLAVNTDARLRELNQGELEGQNMEGLLAHHAELLKNWMADPAHTRMPRGESLLEIQGRGWAAVSEIAARHPGAAVAVVAHNLLNVAVISKALGLDLNHFRRLKQHSSAINEIEFGNHGTVLIRLNDVHHLDGHHD